ncbi:metallophosphoesterase [Bacteroidales bacterium OttesenSCG-928-I21]|nr:metallophosphoesterase [Bacteroidales bacterium OttesenSCG-928-I21]
MKIFLFAFLFLFVLVGYVYLRSFQCLTNTTLPFKISYSVIYFLLFASLFVGFIGADYLPIKLASAFSFIGYSFFMLVVYMAMFFLVIDIAWLIGKFILRISSDSLFPFRIWASGVSFLIVIVTLCIGHYRFNRPIVTEVNISVENPKKNKTMRIVAASDIHLGSSIGKKKAQQYVKLINEQSADLVLFLGDIADRSINPVKDQNMSEDLRKIKSTYGVHGISGNHEYYSSNRKQNFQYYEESGINMLIDNVTLIDNDIYVVGRDDRTNPHRASVSQLITGLHKDNPIILLDHQPFHLEEAQENNVTLQLSGHTHNGQFFPVNLIVKSMYELAYGYLKKGNTHYYVSSGLGIWGPQFRIGSKSEIVVINLKY